MTIPAQVEFPFIGARHVRAVFDGGAISSDGGSVLLREIERRTRLIERLAGAVRDRRDGRSTQHSLVGMLRQRIFGICLGYEDCNDAATLRRDPVLKVLCDRDPFAGADLASQPTLCRLENSVGPLACYRMAEAIFASYCARKRRRPRRVLVDLDLADDRTYGQQELAFFRSHYGGYVYLPLLVFDEEGDLITAVLLPGNVQGPKHIAPIVRRILQRLRKVWPKTHLVVRGDSGFSGPEMFAVCHETGADFVFGFQPNVRLKELAANLQEKARRRYLRTHEKARLFAGARYRARRRWTRSYRIVIKAEHHSDGPNVRFVVTTLAGRPQEIYDDWYVPRGESSENSIKDLKNALKSDRLSCTRFLANQFRLLLHAAAYVLMYELRRAAHATELAEAQMDTLRLRLLKVGVRVETSVRRIWFHLSSGYPWRSTWLQVARRLLLAGTS